MLRKEGGKNISSKLEMKSPQRDFGGEEEVFRRKGFDISPPTLIPALFQAATATQSPPPMKMASIQGPSGELLRFQRDCYINKNLSQSSWGSFSDAHLDL